MHCDAFASQLQLFQRRHDARRGRCLPEQIGLEVDFLESSPGLGSAADGRSKPQSGNKGRLPFMPLGHAAQTSQTLAGKNDQVVSRCGYEFVNPLEDWRRIRRIQNGDKRNTHDTGTAPDQQLFENVELPAFRNRDHLSVQGSRCFMFFHEECYQKKSLL